MDRKIIELVAMHSILYDKCAKDFKNAKKKQQVWEEIAKAINTTADIVQRRWRVLRDKYSKERREMKSIPSGAPSSSDHEWEYFKIMSFLEPFVRSRKTFSNVDIAESSSSSSSLPIEVEVVIENNTSSLSPRSISPFSCNVFREEDDEELNISTKSDTVVMSTPTPSKSSTTQSTPSPSATTPQSKRRREEMSTAVDDAISSVANYLKTKTAVDSDVAFGQYVGAELQKLPKRKKT